ncbi:WecB/TagA/CpsF family glycosyltransferase [Sinorhizobium numidicum]|uniref:WecB/TagA/CpsF family glycosyltransferase n=1 Tax=Sinorhizobium numidicum TaxID=680248 RepID=A0ABY8D583_9HYPH|nr:WecB/TagA/CpsF family glycosyltransferase [Sinorhizobium numidicum]WEX78056.1 WecB/TagA/CpsF family glycosyltransferase [Sinorhizobium numidicum]WEX84715.1 WecB/TagA/CpsF family glycosyltransferase [Sinorhizobium numidicum]
MTNSLLRGAAKPLNPTTGDIAPRDLGWAEALAFADRAVSRAKGQVMVTFLNAGSAKLTMRDEGQGDALRRQELSGCDAARASRLSCDRVFAAKLNESDFVPALLTYVEKPMRVALVGSRSDVLQCAAAVFRARTPWHEFVPIMDAFCDHSISQKVLDRLHSLAPDILVVAVEGLPQRKCVDRRLGQDEAPLVITVSALFDHVTQEQAAAPTLLRHPGLGWLYRLLLGFRRLWRRHFLGDPVVS